MSERGRILWMVQMRGLSPELIKEGAKTVGLLPYLPIRDQSPEAVADLESFCRARLNQPRDEAYYQKLYREWKRDSEHYWGLPIRRRRVDGDD